jgi:membrane protease YdiL (CAAX protease family)
MNHEIRLAILRTLPFLVVVCVIIILIKRQKIRSQDLDLNKPFSFRAYLAWTIGFLLYTLLTEFVLYSLNILEVSRWNHPVSPSIILIFGAVVLAPIAEELIFRGFILNLLSRKKVNIHLGILIQACFFVLLHNFTYENTLSSTIGIAQSLIDAILFGYARRSTKSIYTPITMHMTGNAIAIMERFIF